VSAERTEYDDCRRRVSHDRRRRSTRHAIRGAVADVGAWSLGYLVVYIWKSQAVSEALRGVGFVSQLLGGEAIPAWKASRGSS
jgi:fatty acid desaturase